MKKLPIIGWLFALLLSGLLLSVPAKNVFAQKPDTLRPKNILMLFALEPGQPLYEKIVEGIKQRIVTDYPYPVNFYMDFLEFSRFRNEEHLIEYFEYTKKKYSGIQFDLLVSIGPNLYPVIKKYGSPLLDSLPTLCFELNFPSLNKLYSLQSKNETGVFLDLDFDKHIQFALELMPDTRNIYVFSGSSDLDRKYAEAFEQALRGFGNKYKITGFAGLGIPRLIDAVQKLPGNSIIFFTTYQSDTSGNTYYGREIIKAIAGFSNAPIFVMFDNAIEGTVGGLVVNTAQLGDKLGGVTVRILKGESPESIGNYHSNFFSYIFDWNQLKKWNISEKSLPQGSILLNRERSFFDKYRSYIFTAVTFLVFQSLLLIYIILLFRKQKKLSGIITDKDNRYKLLVDHNRLSKLSEFTASLSHELNQPLTAILSSSQASLRYLKKGEIDTQLFEEILGNIVEDVKRASAIILSLRRMIKKDSKEKSRIGVNGIVNEVLLLFRGQSTVQDIIIERENGTEEQYVYADSVLIQQVILNLLLNASEALEKKTGGSRKILLRTKLLDGFVNVSVLDNGPGIPASIKNDIFNPFFTTKNNGMGIGLAICRSIIEDHEGTLQCEDNLSGGAVFTFKLRAVE